MIVRMSVSCLLLRFFHVVLHFAYVMYYSRPRRKRSFWTFFFGWLNCSRDPSIGHAHETPVHFVRVLPVCVCNLGIGIAKSGSRQHDTVANVAPSTTQGQHMSYSVSNFWNNSFSTSQAPVVQILEQQWLKLTSKLLFMFMNSILVSVFILLVSSHSRIHYQSSLLVTFTNPPNQFYQQTRPQKVVKCNKINYCWRTIAE